MSTVLLDRLFTGRSASMDENARQYVEHYLIRTTSNSEDPREVWNTSGTPMGGDSYGTDLGAVVRSIAVKLHRPDDWQYWIKTCTFSTRPLNFDNTGNKPGPPNARGGFNDSSPTQEPDTYSTSGLFREVPAHYDRNGKPYQSSAGQAFAGATKELCTFVLNINRNVAVTQQSQQYGYLDGGGAVNSDAVFSDEDIGKWKIAGWNSSRKWRQGTSYFGEQLTLHYRSEGWRKYSLDKGKWHQKTSELNATAGSHYNALAPTIAKDIHGNAMGDGVLLDGRGNKLADITTVLTEPMTATTGVAFVANHSSTFPEIAGDTITVLGVPISIYPTHSNVVGRVNGLYIRIDDEIMQVTLADDSGGEFFAVQRGVRNTRAASHADNSTVYMAEFYQEFVQYPELPFVPIGINWSVWNH